MQLSVVQEKKIEYTYKNSRVHSYLISPQNIEV
jgi:hypothetical protein